MEARKETGIEAEQSRASGQPATLEYCHWLQSGVQSFLEFSILENKGIRHGDVCHIWLRWPLLWDTSSVNQMPSPWLHIRREDRRTGRNSPLIRKSHFEGGWLLGEASIGQQSDGILQEHPSASSSTQGPAAPYSSPSWAHWSSCHSAPITAAPSGGHPRMSGPLSAPRKIWGGPCSNLLLSWFWLVSCNLVLAQVGLGKHEPCKCQDDHSNGSNCELIFFFF